MNKSKAERLVEALTLKYEQDLKAIMKEVEMCPASIVEIKDLTDLYLKDIKDIYIESGKE